MSRKALNFDLDDKVVESIFGENNTTAAYRKIKTFLTKHGFEHRQYSGYVSSQPLTYFAVKDIVSRLYEKNPWLFDAVKALDITSVGSMYDLMKDMLAERDRAESIEDEY
jgi:virulence-associated protein VapD